MLLDATPRHFGLMREKNVLRYFGVAGAEVLEFQHRLNEAGEFPAGSRASFFFQKSCNEVTGISLALLLQTRRYLHGPL